MVELDRVVFDQQLREGAPDDDVWLEVALVHPAALPGQYRCVISTRFVLADKRVAAAVAKVQQGWSKRFRAYFFRVGEARRFVYDPNARKITRAHGAKSRYELVHDATRIYQYLNVIALAWDWLGFDLRSNAWSIRKSIRDRDKAPVLALRLFAGEYTNGQQPSDRRRPKLTPDLVKRVGEALGYVSASGSRQLPRRKRPDGPIDRRLLSLVAKILAGECRRPADTLLRTVVRPALLGGVSAGLIFESTEQIVRRDVPTGAKTKRLTARARAAKAAPVEAMPRNTRKAPNGLMARR
ncbi:MAG: hypothetical protein SF182_22755 [Deltaproteobacteria bacterium]|nr:hypothetical protein [Deltaproteobacteria bacterium]